MDRRESPPLHEAAGFEIRILLIEIKRRFLMKMNRSSLFWGILLIGGGLAVTIALATNNVDDAAVGSPLFFGLLLPFAAAYLTDRTKNWWALIPGGVMLFLTLVTLLVDNVGGDIGWKVRESISLSSVNGYTSAQ
jgi:hypothetical protein